jgi:hypothetical protein
MISIIIRAEGSPQLLVETLNPLVSGVVQGLVGKLYIVAQPNRDDLSHIAEEAGAIFIEAKTWDVSLMQIANNAQSDWVLLVDCGVIIEPSLWACVERHIKRGDNQIAISKYQASLLSPIHKIRGKITLDQVVLIKLKAINNAIFEHSFGRKLHIMPTNTCRLKL